jgi:bacillopeptidase F (M6 metalloprotease family)
MKDLKIELNTPVSFLTVGQLIDILKSTAEITQVAVSEKKYIYSIQGLADFLQCSIVTAQKLKNSGLIPCKQLGRKLIFEEGEILAAMHSNKLSKN